MAHTKPPTKPFSELVKTLGDHLDPQPTEMGECFRFGRRLQNKGVASFMAEFTTSFHILWLWRKSVNSIKIPICFGSPLRGHTEKTGHD